jgi:hypothetical protein
MGGLFSSPKAPAPPPPPPEPPTRSDADIQAAALAERQRRARATGRSATILTSGQGVVDGVSPATKTLLGA